MSHRPTLIYPHFKRIFAVRRRPNGTLRIGESYPGRAMEAEDEDGALLRLIELMDGTRSIAQLTADMRRDWPEITEDDVDALVCDLDSAGYAYDASDAPMQPTDAAGPDPADERYGVNRNYFSYYANMSRSPTAFQRRLCDARLTIVGIGSLGGAILAQAAGLGIGYVAVVDDDRVERSNLNRQWLFRESDIGVSKLDAAARFIEGYRPGIRLEQFEMKIRSAEEAGSIVKGSDLVVLAADEPYYELERWINRACVEQGVPFIAGGLNAAEGYVYTVVPGVTGCVACADLMYGRDHPEAAEHAEANRAASAKPPSAAIAPNYALLSGWIGGDIVKRLTGCAPPVSLGRWIGFSFETYAWETKLDFTAGDARCRVCGGLAAPPRP